MKTRLCILLCAFALGALAQSFTTTPAFRGAAAIQAFPSAAGEWNPTNPVISGLLAWYVADDYTTNAGVPALPDRWTNAWNLTNLDSAAYWPTDGEDVNGHKSLYFLRKYLRNTSYTSGVPHEVFIVAKPMNGTNTTDKVTFLGGLNVSFEHSLSFDTIYAGQMRIGVNTVYLTGGPALTNEWGLWDMCIAGSTTNSRLFYNTANFGAGVINSTAGCDGLQVGRNRSGLNGTYMTGYVAEVVCFATNLTSSQRSSVSSGLMQRYGISPLVLGTTLNQSYGSSGQASCRVPHQRKLFYAQGMWWVFYSAMNGETRPWNIYYATSATGSTWSSPTLFTNTYNVDASWCLKYDSSGKMHFIRTLTNSPTYGGLVYRRGNPQANGTITWDADWQTVSATANIISDPSIEVDASGSVWIAHANALSGGDCVVQKNGATDGTWSSAAGFPVTVTSSADNRYGVLAALTNGMEVVVYRFGSTINAASGYCFTNGDNTVSAEGDVTLAAVNAETTSRAGVGRISCCGSNGTVWLVYQDAAHNILVKSRDPSGTWSAETTLASGADTESSPQIAFNGGEMVVAWGHIPNAQARWCYYNGSWSAVQTYCVGSLESSYEHLLIPEVCNGTQIAALWLTGAWETMVAVFNYR